jgi:flavodoxin
MRILVTYTSRTGNTKKVAENIFQEIREEKEIKELKAVESLEGYDFVFVGLPIENFGPAKAARNFLEEHVKGKKVALFITHGSPEYAELLPEWLAKCKEGAAGAELVGVFNCQGELAQNVIDAMARHPDPKVRAWAEMGSTTKGQPDATRLERARVFARETMEKIRES